MHSAMHSRFFALCSIVVIIALLFFAQFNDVNNDRKGFAEEDI
jgi:hypothetical protein